MSDVIAEDQAPAEAPAEEPVAAPELPDNHPGVEDGHVDANGDTYVYEYDEAGNYTGWHKAPPEGTVIE